METILVNVLKNRSENDLYKGEPLQSPQDAKKTRNCKAVFDPLSRKCPDDLTTLVPLNSKEVLRCLEERFNKGQIWSKAGVTLIAVNPFKETQQIQKDVVCQYHSQNCQDLPPHIYAIAEKAYSSMKLELDSINQSIIVSGESGAGKTWSARCMMNYLTSLAEYNPGGFSPSPVHCIERRIVDSNPILEAFGNASTIRNHNSSRFGKYIQLQFNRCGYIIGASIQTYLLEKTRVVHQNHAEKNFHIFYQMCSGTTPEEKEAWQLQDTDGSEFEFSYLPESILHKSDDTGLTFHLTRNAMKNVGMTEKHQEKIFKVLSGILHIGNLLFAQDEDDDACDLDDKEETNLKCCCSLLGLKEETLRKYLICRRIAAHHSKRKSIFMKPCSRPEAENRRDCLAKLLYSRLFDWLVAFLNKHTSANHSHSFIGLLDIYGFESFHTNSLEQLCINYANEKLQQHFVSYFLKAEQEEYKKEGLSWSFCQFTNNQPCLDVIEGQMSVFGLLNEECQMNRTPDAVALQERILSSIPGKHVKATTNTGKKRASFLIKHYADDVAYTVEGLVEKNKDLIPPDLIEMLASSKNLFIRTLIQRDHMANQKSKENNKKSQAKTVVTKFKNSLNSLMTTLRSTTPHYIRCIKPNSQCVAGIFDREYVSNQLKACGVMETITISKAGFPYKIPFEEFVSRYLTSKRTTDPTKECCVQILENAVGVIDKENKTESEIKVGKTKVFLREKHLNQLELLRNQHILSAVLCIQKSWRHHQRKKEIQRRERAAIVIQSFYRGHQARCQIQRMHDAAQIIQHAMLMYLIMKEEQRVADELRWIDELKEDEIAIDDNKEMNCSQNTSIPNQPDGLCQGAISTEAHQSLDDSLYTNDSFCSDDSLCTDDSLLSPVDQGPSRVPSRSWFPSYQSQLPIIQSGLFGRLANHKNKVPQIETISCLDDEIDGDDDMNICEEAEDFTEDGELNVTQGEVHDPSWNSASLTGKPVVEIAVGAVMVGLLLTGPMGI